MRSLSSLLGASILSLYNRATPDAHEYALACSLAIKLAAEAFSMAFILKSYVLDIVLHVLRIQGRGAHHGMDDEGGPVQQCILHSSIKR